jgi:hypothetical protein
MTDNKLSEMKAGLQKLGENFVTELKNRNFEVKDWNIAVGKAGEATTLKISFEVDMTKK